MRLFYSLLLLITVSPALAQLTPTYDDVWVPMSDGDSLEADVYIPAGVDSAEVVLIQTPYNKNLYVWSLPIGIGQNLDSQPFIWVFVDWRGFYGSSQADVSNVDRGQDGYDICEWITQQSWHKDRIGTWGPSALGGVQYQTITKSHPNHTCAVPQVATGHQAYDSYFYGGVLEEARLNQLDALGYGLSPIVYANPYDNVIWQVAENDTWYADDIDIPTLQIGGWYDHNIDKMMDFYKDSRNMADINVQDEQWLLVGPWVHGGTGAAYVGSATQGELSFPTAEFKCDSMTWDFFYYYLLDSANNWNNTDYITYFEMGGNNVWKTSNDDDISSLATSILFLDQNGQLGSQMGVDSTIFNADPNDPSPTIGGATLSTGLDQGPYDQSVLDNRSDVITFETAALSEEVSITGRCHADLYISSDQPDCDIAIRLVDVYPDGTNMLITDGIKRMRFRNNDYTQAGESFMSPGVVYNVQIDLPFTHYTWLPGHKIKIYISANHADRFHVNLQDGGQMYNSGNTGNVAEISVHHNSTYPSQLNLAGANPSLSIADEDATSKTLEVYPNPTENKLNVTGDFIGYPFEIVDISGRQVLKGKLTDQKVNVSALKPGLYYFQILDQNGIKINRTFVKR